MCNDECTCKDEGKSPGEEPRRTLEQSYLESLKFLLDGDPGLFDLFVDACQEEYSEDPNGWEDEVTAGEAWDKLDFPRLANYGLVTFASTSRRKKDSGSYMVNGDLIRLVAARVKGEGLGRYIE